MNNRESKIMDVSENPKVGEVPNKKAGGAGTSKKVGGKAIRRKGKTTELGKEVEEQEATETEETVTQMTIEQLLGPTALPIASGSASALSAGSVEAKETGSDRPGNAEESTELGSSLARSSQLIGAKLRDGTVLMSENSTVLMPENSTVLMSENSTVLMSENSREDDERMMTKGDQFLLAETDEQDPMLPAPVRRMRGSEVISPTVNGMRQFGLSKGVISRAIVKFPSPPEPHPCTVCFHFPSTFLTHRYVLDMVRSVIGSIPGSSVPAIQFIDRNTLHGAQGMDNRWLITLNSVEAKNVLVSSGLTLFNRKITLKNYDDILRSEYSEYLEYVKMQRQLYAKMKDELNDISEDGPEVTSAANKGDDVMNADNAGNSTDAN